MISSRGSDFSPPNIRGRCFSNFDPAIFVATGAMIPQMKRLKPNTTGQMTFPLSQENGSDMTISDMPPNEARVAAGVLALAASGIAAWRGEGWFVVIFLIAFLLALAGEGDRHIALRALFRYCDGSDRCMPRCC